MSTYRGELLAAYGQIGALLNYSDITDDFTRESAIQTFDVLEATIARAKILLSQGKREEKP